jgi:6-phosphofructokinase 2
MGGYNGLEIEGRLTNEGIVSDFTRVTGETKENLVIHQRKKKTETLLSMPAAEVAPFDLTRLHNKIRQLPRDSYLVVSGKVPPGCNDNFYAQIITSLKDKNIKVFLDTDGETLKKGVQAGPYLWKPNIHEFGRLVERNLKDHDEVMEALRPYLDITEYSVVSMGARGALGASRNEAYCAVPPKVAVKSSIGAGNALLAGVVYGLSQKMSFKDALVLGVACGTASTVTADPALCRKSDVEEILKDVSLQNV